MTERARIIDHETGEIVPPEAPGYAPIPILDARAPGGVRQETGVGGWIATISAGYRDEQGYPQRSDTIQVHDPDGRAAELAARVEAGGGRSLTVAVLFDDPQLFLHQSFTCYARTRLVAFGDQYVITEFVEAGKSAKGQPTYEPRRYPCGTDDYDRVRASCRVTFSLAFVLAEWRGARAHVVFPDGVGHYRLRSGSSHSLRTIVGSLEEIRRLTGGRLAGIPLTLRLEEWEVVDPQGMRRAAPVFTLALRPPEAIRLESGNFQQVIGGALLAGEALRVRALPPPAETMADLAEEPTDDEEQPPEGAGEDLGDTLDGPPDPVGEPTAEQLSRIQSGEVRCDADHYRRAFFGTVDGTPLDDEGPRAAWLRDLTDGGIDSLSEYLATASEAAASRLVARAAEWVEAWRREHGPTQDQRRALRKIAEGDHLTTAQLDGLAEHKFGRPLRKLTREETGELIVLLQPAGRGGRP